MVNSSAYARINGSAVHLQSGRLGEFLVSIYASLFDKRASGVGVALESLVGKNARTALGMFVDTIASPHCPEEPIR